MRGMEEQRIKMEEQSIKMEEQRTKLEDHAKAIASWEAGSAAAEGESTAAAEADWGYDQEGRWMGGHQDPWWSWHNDGGMVNDPWSDPPGLVGSTSRTAGGLPSAAPALMRSIEPGLGRCGQWSSRQSVNQDPRESRSYGAADSTPWIAGGLPSAAPAQEDSQTAGGLPSAAPAPMRPTGPGLGRCEQWGSRQPHWNQESARTDARESWSHGGHGWRGNASSRNSSSHWGRSGPTHQLDRKDIDKPEKFSGDTSK